MKKVRERHYSIGEAARICGVTVKQIRNWEEKHYIPAPYRVICGERSYREFTEADLKIIRRIKSYVEKGYRLSTAARKAKKSIQKEDI
jgi:DNA-binding transcriptional MerR regulator